MVAEDVRIDYTPCPKCDARSLDLEVRPKTILQRLRNFGERWPSHREVIEDRIVVVCRVCGHELPVRLRAN